MQRQAVAQSEEAFPHLETDRLILRELRLDAADKAAVFQIFSDAHVTRYDTVRTFTHLAQARVVLERRINRFWRGKGIRWGITLKGNDRLIGSCGFTWLRQRRGTGELGYELARSYWNRGIMTEALAAVITYGFSQRRLNNIEAWVVPGNKASARVLLKLGFQSEGVVPRKGYWNGRFHDLELFSLLQEMSNL